MPRIGDLIRHATAVKRQNKKPYWRQLLEIARLATGKQRLSPSEYYELGVFDDAAYTASQKLDCVGWRASAQIDRRLNHRYWRAAANDKLLNYALLQHFGFPIPRTQACYSPLGRHIGPEQRPRSRQELEDFLRTGLTFPAFIKPIHGSYGRDTFLLESFDTAHDRFVDARGKVVPLGNLLDTCTNSQFTGMLFQDCLRPHPQVRALVGNTTSCVRVIVAVPPTGPEVHLAFWKIARAHNITDNFCMGETGNLLAWVDKQSGTVERVVTGLWPDGRAVTQHPDTGQTILGTTLPDWQAAMTMCLAAAVHFPGLKLQHWDVAFCEDGPVLMELNTEADLGVPQYLGQAPFINQTIRDML
jgi:hypothetical protein